MPDTLHAITRSLDADLRTLTTVSQNVANLGTPGYRGVRAVPDFETSAGLRTGLDLREAGLMQTARPLDLALRGDGFFAIQRGDQVLLTRNGAFRLDADGTLVTAVGDRVLGIGGALSLPAGALRVDASGAVWTGAQALGQLQVLAVADPARLQPAGDGAYAYDGPAAEWNGAIVQGALERSNVDAADETIRLMEATRHAETVQRALSMYDRVMDTGINHIGEN